MASKICYKASCKLCNLLLSLDIIKWDKQALLGLSTYSRNPTHQKDPELKLKINLFGDYDDQRRVFASKSNLNQSDILLLLDFVVLRWYVGFSTRCSDIIVRFGKISVRSIKPDLDQILRDLKELIRSLPWPGGFDQSKELWSCGGQRPIWPQLVTDGTILDSSWSGRVAVLP